MYACMYVCMYVCQLFMATYHCFKSENMITSHGENISIMINKDMALNSLQCSGINYLMSQLELMSGG